MKEPPRYLPMRAAPMREPHSQVRKREVPNVKEKSGDDDDRVGVDEEGMYSDTDSLVELLRCMTR